MTIFSLDLRDHICHRSVYSETVLPPSSAEPEPSLSFGVDWSERTYSTAHCWFPYCFNKSLPHPSCAYTLCRISQSINTSTFVQCGTCEIFIHRDHLVECKTAANIRGYILPCRPSFYDSNETENHNEYNQHHWSFVPVLKKSCMRCRRKAISRTFTDGNIRTSTISSETCTSQVSVKANDIKKLPDSKPLKSSSGLVCLWCSRTCHQQCWENVSDTEDQKKCDYGKFK